MIQLVVVEPADQVWVVRQPSIDSTQVFASGAKAEAVARSLGASLAEAGESTEIRIYLRGGALAGRFACSGQA
jgi:hypothetical protein